MSLIERIERLESKLVDLEAKEQINFSNDICLLGEKIDRLYDLVGCESNGHIPKEDEPQTINSNGFMDIDSEDDKCGDGDGFIIKGEQGKYVARITRAPHSVVKRPYWTSDSGYAKRYNTEVEAKKIIKTYKIKNALVVS